MSYYDQLRDPRWQRKRLEIMQASDFRCSQCDSNEKTLNIHHGHYEKGLAPWEYPTESLHCLCEDCHKKSQDLSTEINRKIGKLSQHELEQVLGYLTGIEMESDTSTAHEIFSFEMALGVGDVFGLGPEVIINSVVDCSIDGSTLIKMSKNLKRRK